MIDSNEDIDARLHRLAVQTAAIEPHPGFTDRVMARLALEGSGWLQRVPSLWQRALPLAAFLAMLSMAWAYRNARVADMHRAIASIADEHAELDY